MVPLAVVTCTVVGWDFANTENTININMMGTHGHFGTGGLSGEQSLLFSPN